MVVEICEREVATLWIDGKKPTGRWLCREEDTGKLIVNEPDGSPLRIGEHRITEIEVTQLNVPWNSSILALRREPWKVVFDTDGIPTGITLHTEAGTYVGPIISLTTCEPDEESVVVNLFNGEDCELDRTMLYMRAILDGPFN